MEAVGQLAGGIAHDFNNLLTVILGRLDLIAVPTGDANARHVETATRAAARAAELTAQLLGFARRRPIRLLPVDPRAVLTGMADILHRTIDPRIQVRVEADDDAPAALADAGALEQILLNLCLNARDVMPEGGTLTLSAARARVLPGGAGWCAEARPGDFVRIGVADTGGGMSDDVKARIFEPFFTTKPPGKGTGLGLAMVYGILTQHAGWVTCESAPGRGTRFDLYFPEGVAPPAPAPSAAPVFALAVLVVDDEPGIRAFTRAVLERDGCAVDEADTTAAGLDRVRAAPVRPNPAGPDDGRREQRRDPAGTAAAVAGVAGAGDERDVPRRPAAGGRTGSCRSRSCRKTCSRACGRCWATNSSLRRNRAVV